jgi:membrane fusion protein (multidrug efflux system)
LRAVSTGAYVSPGDRIATLRVTNPLKLEFSVPELYLGRVREGAAVVFTVPGQEGTFRATVYAIEPSVEQATRAFTVRARTSNPGELSPGAFAEVELVLDQVDDALVVPAAALVPGADSASVFVVEEGKAVRRSVLPGIRTADRVQVTGAVAEGDLVLTSGVDQVRSGQDVRISQTDG